jgi:hypothetical protein
MGWESLSTLLLCLPAALVLLACACGLAVLGPCAARPAAHPTPTGDRRRGRSSRAGSPEALLKRREDARSYTAITMFSTPSTTASPRR